GNIEEADDVVGEVENKNVLDAALIAAAQAVEHYEMTRYGTLIAWAKQLGRADCAKLLEQNLQEEKAADSKLIALAESNVNRKAACPACRPLRPRRFGRGRAPLNDPTKFASIPPSVGMCVPRKVRGRCD